MEKIAVASDHAGYQLKNTVIEYLNSKGFETVDFGCYTGESCDYPDYAHPLAAAIESGEFARGFVFCGSGNGINMTVNKHQGIRSAICWNKEVAELARTHNNANVCSIPSRFISEPLTFEIVDIFLNGQFEGGRHERRINKIPLS
jgi:ribose 5-phosphate isomerase B